MLEIYVFLNAMLFFGLSITTGDEKSNICSFPVEAKKAATAGKKERILFRGLMKRIPEITESIPQAEILGFKFSYQHSIALKSVVSFHSRSLQSKIHRLHL